MNDALKRELRSIEGGKVEKRSLEISIIEMVKMRSRTATIQG